MSKTIKVIRKTIGKKILLFKILYARITISEGFVYSADQEFEEVRIMLLVASYKRIYEAEARELSKFVSTCWDNYDFSEKTTELERRVPRIYFNDNIDVEVKGRRPEHIEGFGYEKFIRRYEITYRDKQYIFVVTVDSYWNCVRKFWITAYGIIREHDNDREQVMLFKESL